MGRRRQESVGMANAKKWLAAGAAKQPTGRDCQKRGPRRGGSRPITSPGIGNANKAPPETGKNEKKEQVYA